MTELNGGGNLSDLASYFHEISKVKVAGTSISQLLRNEILEKLKASVSQSSCGKCKCCTSITNVLSNVQTEIIQSSEGLYDNEIPVVGNSHMENEPMETLAETTWSTSKVASSTDNNDTGRQNSKKRKKSIPGVSGQQKSRVVKSNTKKTPNSKCEPKDNEKKKLPEELTNISAKKRQKTRDEREMHSSRNLPSRSCTKNISYSSKIPQIRSPFDEQEIKKPSMCLPQK